MSPGNKLQDAITKVEQAGFEHGAAHKCDGEGCEEAARLLQALRGAVKALDAYLAEPRGGHSAPVPAQIEVVGFDFDDDDDYDVDPLEKGSCEDCRTVTNLSDSGRCGGCERAYQARIR